MKLIILDAGDAFELDGFNKLLIKHPKTRKTILERYLETFDVDAVEIVVGYKAIQLMNEYPEFKYVYNKDWQTTGSAYSLSLALTSEPCYVVSSDYIISDQAIEAMREYENCVVVKNTENRRISSLNAVIKDGRVLDVYRGSSRNNDPEFINIIKMTDADMLSSFRRESVSNPTSYAGENLPLSCDKPIHALRVNVADVFEINTPTDYITFVERSMR